MGSYWAAHVLRCLISGGAGETSLAEIGSAFTSWAGVDDFQVRSLLAEAYGQMGQPSEGLRLVAEALAQGEPRTARVWLPLLYQVHGDLLLHMDPASGEAEKSFQQAILVARDLGARSLELRAALSLARLRARQDRREEGREALAGIYGEFTEGFETSDLRTARALLQELA
jgi:predicted ATPase